MIAPSVFFLIFCFGVSESAKILGIFPMASPSHYILGSALMKGLAEAGHNVTMVSPYSVKELPKGGTWREIVMEEIAEEMNKRFNDSSSFQKKIGGPILLFLMLNGPGIHKTEQVLTHPKIQKLIHSGEKFDVVIVHQFFNDALKAFANHFGAHLVLFSNNAANSFVDTLVGNPSLPSHSPEIVMGYSGRMSFLQRVLNSALKFGTVLNLNTIFYRKQNALIQKYFPNPVEIEDVLYNTSLVLLNSHTSFSDPGPTVPCMIEIGGFHIKPPRKLPDNLQKFLDDAKDGVIYFSLGSNLKSKNLPKEKRDAILNAFAKRKEKVLWKWEDDTMPGRPANVFLSKWFPQQDLLAHPNVKVFITHGGILSTTETIYHGVPIIAIPFFADQAMNAKTAEEAGFGLVQSFEDLSEQALSTLLEEITTNPIYRENVKKRSRIMQDRQVRPLDNAIYWIEYVIRHNGASHLRVPYLHLAWYQYYLLDVFVFIFFFFVLSIVILKKLVSYLCRRRRENLRKQKTF